MVATGEYNLDRTKINKVNHENRYHHRKEHLPCTKEIRCGIVLQNTQTCKKEEKKDNLLEDERKRSFQPKHAMNRQGRKIFQLKKAFIRQNYQPMPTSEPNGFLNNTMQSHQHRLGPVIAGDDNLGVPRKHREFLLADLPAALHLAIPSIDRPLNCLHHLVPRILHHLPLVPQIFNRRISRNQSNCMGTRSLTRPIRIPSIRA